MVIIVLASCKHKTETAASVNKPNPFSGVYVNARTLTDTIDFTPYKDSPTFDLNRGIDSVGASSRLKGNSGYYRFAVNGNKIRVDWCFASKRDTTSYVFQMTGDTLRIGNFYEGERKSLEEVFVRVD